MKIKAVIFDLNGVFLKSDFLSARVEKKYGVDGDVFWKVLKEGLKIARKPNSPSFFGLCESGFEGIGFKIEEEEFFDFWFSGESLVMELLNYSRELRERGLRIFILSNNFKERTEFYRKNFPEIFNVVDKAYFSWETGLVKPDVEVFRNVLQENGLLPDECIYFDDSDNNVEVAKSLRIHAERYENLEVTKKLIEDLV